MAVVALVVVVEVEQVAGVTPEARIYSDAECSSFNSMQKRQIQELKGQEGWINGQTPPPECTIDQHGFATTSTALVAAVQRSIASTSSNNGTIVPLPPTP